LLPAWQAVIPNGPLHPLHSSAAAGADAGNVAALLYARLLELMSPLAALCPPAMVIDKMRYSAFAGPRLLAHLRQRWVDALLVSGSETDVCLLAMVLGAVDMGYRVILVRDVLCSSSDEGHDMLMHLYHNRFSEQIETADAETILSCWP
jgi:nicotinamidase-related amidase